MGLNWWLGVYALLTCGFSSTATLCPPADYFINYIITAYLLIPYLQQTELFESTFLLYLPHSIPTILPGPWNRADAQQILLLNEFFMLLHSLPILILALTLQFAGLAQCFLTFFLYQLPWKMIIFVRCTDVNDRVCSRLQVISPRP